jgi:hypothetical protein
MVLNAKYLPPIRKTFLTLVSLFSYMAKPIKNTPVLRGNEATHFYSTLESNRNKKVDKARLLAIRDSARQLRAISQPR